MDCKEQQWNTCDKHPEHFVDDDLTLVMSHHFSSPVFPLTQNTFSVGDRENTSEEYDENYDGPEKDFHLPGFTL